MADTDEFGGTVVAEPEKDEFGGIVAPTGKDEFGGNVVAETRPEKKARLKREIAAIPDTGTGWLSGETLRQFPQSFSELGTSPLTLPDEETNANIDRLIERGSDFVAPVFGRPDLATREQVGQFAKAGAHLAKGAVDFPTSPKGMVAMAAQATPLAPYVNLYLAGEQAGQVPALAQRAGELSVTGTPEEQIAANTDLGAAVVTPGIMAPAIGRPEFSPARLTKEDFASSSIRPEDATGYVPPAEPVVSLRRGPAGTSPFEYEPIPTKGTLPPNAAMRAMAKEVGGTPPNAGGTIAEQSIEPSGLRTVSEVAPTQPAAGLPAIPANKGLVDLLAETLNPKEEITQPQIQNISQEPGVVGTSRAELEAKRADYEAGRSEKISQDQEPILNYTKALTENQLRIMAPKLETQGKVLVGADIQAAKELQTKLEQANQESRDIADHQVELRRQLEKSQADQRAAEAEATRAELAGDQQSADARRLQARQNSMEVDHADSMLQRFQVSSRLAAEEAKRRAQDLADFLKAKSQAISEEQQPILNYEKPLSPNSLRIMQESLRSAINANRLASPERRGIITGSPLEDWADGVIKDVSRSTSANGFADPRLMGAVVVKAAALFERGVTDGAQWSDAMIKEFGPEVRPYLARIRKQAVEMRAKAFLQSGLPQPKEPSAIQEPIPKQVGVREQGAVRQGVGEENRLPQPAAAGETEAGTGPAPLHEEITEAVTNPNSGKLAGFKNFVSNLAGETLPKTHRADRETGEAGARYGASRVGAEYAAEAFAKDVLRGVDGTKFQAALTEDNLRSIRDNFLAKGEDDAAAHVRDIFDMSGSPFKTEEEYQSFLKEPETQAALERYKTRRENDIEPLYKQARDIDPNVDLPGRGKQTGARTNLYVPDEETGGVPQIRSTPNLRATFKRRTRFANPASGAAEAYGFDFNKAMENTYSGLYEIANKNAFDKKLVDTGNAVIGKPGERVVFPDGETAEAFPLKAQTLINRGAAIPRNQDIYVRKSLADEYAGASNTRKAPPLVTANMLKLTEGVGNLFNKVAVAGVTDAAIHAKNLGATLLTRPGVIGGNLALDSAASLVQPAYAIASLTKAFAKGLKDNTDQLAELAQIGALREKHPGAWKMSQMLEKVDRIVRLSLDDTYQTLAKQGVVENTEQARREFVNQAGNYNKRLQGYYTSILKQTGISPFIVAGKTMNANAVRTMTLNPGVKATSNLNAALLRANIFSKWLGVAGMVMGANYLLTGKVSGRPGTPLGKIDTGKDDSAGRPVLIPAFDMMGLGRAARVTGVRGYVEAKRLGLPEGEAESAAFRDIANSQIGPVAGPAVKFAYGATIGQPLGVNIGQGDYEPPFYGERGWLKNVKQAATEVNAGVNAVHAWMQPGATWKDFVSKLVPGISPQPGKPANLMDNYAEKVSWAENNKAMEFVIGKARHMDQDAKISYLQQKLLQLPESERAHAWQEIKRRKVLVQGR